MRNFLACLILIILVLGCKTKKEVAKVAIPEPKTVTDIPLGKPEISVGFYNVENLFDTKDDIDKLDEDWLPEGRQKWDKERYLKKIDQISRVIEEMGAPEIVGLCEVENAAVLRDLVNNSRLKKYEYEFVHFESPDRRGIDNAILIQSKKVWILDKSIVRFEFPKDIVEDYTSRDLLIVKAQAFGRKIHFLVNHWPSRRGGLEASEPKRTFVAGHVRKAVDSLMKVTPNVVIMGDFNDEPNNKSIQEVLGAKSFSERGDLKNLFFDKMEKGEGSYNYRGNWNMLDQIIVSTNMSTKMDDIFAHDPVIFKEDWMTYDDPKKGKVPNRTYGGPNYYGGFSDHFPVKIDLLFQ